MTKEVKGLARESDSLLLYFLEEKVNHRNEFCTCLRSVFSNMAFIDESANIKCEFKDFLMPVMKWIITLGYYIH